MIKIGSRNLLKMVKESPQGCYLDGGKTYGEILLPGSLAPDNLAVGDTIDVFIYRDSEDRLVATTQTPKVYVGQAAYLEVVGINGRIGAFLDWGLDKDLLLPFRESKGHLEVGEGVVVYVFLDESSDRIVASMRLDRHIGNNDRPRYNVGQEVDLLVERQTPLGYAAIVENTDWGLLYFNQLSEELEYGQMMKGYVTRVRPDGKIDLSRDQTGFQRVRTIRQTIIHKLKEKGGKLPYNDKTPSEVIREEFDVSKKAFKQAIGTLYKEQLIVIEEAGIRLTDSSEKKAPKKKAAAPRRSNSRETEPKPPKASLWGNVPKSSE
ncbi:S1-like domain-containing RNA-binding protein [Puniceicoccaceae bacterium K14]|nr:S1-like domain-containing RNA-binding protein [Puniceicoccaceae bacterium K14]